MKQNAHNMLYITYDNVNFALGLNVIYFYTITVKSLFFFFFFFFFFVVVVVFFFFVFSDYGMN